MQVNQIVDPVVDSAYKDVWMATAKVRFLKAHRLQSYDVFLEFFYIIAKIRIWSSCMLCISAAAYSWLPSKLLISLFNQKFL